MCKGDSAALPVGKDPEVEGFRGPRADLDMYGKLPFSGQETRLISLQSGALLA